MKRNRKMNPKDKGGDRKPRNYNRKPSNQDRDEVRRNEYSGNARNDVSWYNRNPNLLLAAGSFPYPYRPGMPVRLGKYQYRGKEKEHIYPIPGAMVLDWMPNLGKSNSATDPASVLGKEIYARVRQVYSGALDADAPDFVMYVMAVDSITSYIAWLKRTFRCINAWSPENYFMPDGLLRGMGFTYAEIANLRTDKTNLWQCINDLVLQSHKFTVPASLDVFNRHYWMNDNVYTDAQSLNSQFYLFNMRALYKYSELPMPNGDLAAGLQMTLMPTQVTHSTALTVQDLYNFGLDLINALVTWDDAYTINGYLRRAFEQEAQFVVAEIGATDILTPVYEPEVLMQIENSRVAPLLRNVTDLSTFNVTQDVTTNAIIADPRYVVTNSSDIIGLTTEGGWDLAPVLSVRSDSPTVADSVVASRLQATILADVGSTETTIHIDAGTEIPISWRTSYIDTSANVVTYGAYHQQLILRITMNDINVLRNQIDYLGNAYLVSAFDWHPIAFIVVVLNNGTQDIATYTRVNGDVHNVTTITRENLNNLHKICLYSEFNSFGLI